MIEKTEFTDVNEAFEVIFNAAVAGNMNRAKVSTRNPYTKNDFGAKVSTKTLPATSITAGLKMVLLIHDKQQ